MRLNSKVAVALVRAAMCGALLACIAGCDDQPLGEDEGKAKSLDATGQDGEAVGDVADGAGQDGATPFDAAGPAVADVVAAPDLPMATDAGPDAAAAPGDAGPANDTQGAPEAGPTLVDGATADTGTDAGATDPCGACPVGAQPKADHPAAKTTASLMEPQDIEYGSGMFEGFKEMRVYKPLKPGVLPVLFFVPGKQLHKTGSLLSPTLGHAYQAMLEHVARRGYVVVFVRVENLATDCDHGKMADYLLAATQKLFEKVSVADKDRVAFAGHSMGAKVALLAAAKTLNDDKDGKWVNPQAVFAFNLSNEKPPVCLAPWQDAAAALAYVDAKSPVRFTFVQTHGDKVAPYLDPKKPNTVAVYNGLKVTHRQIIVLHGTGKGDPNPATQPELHDDHAAPLTVEGNVGGIADWGLPASHLDALDWYGYWKILVGGLDFHFYQGDAKWAYGALRTHGGTLPDGKIVQHEVYKQAW